MRYVHVVLALTAAFCTASIGWAQFGLQGAPEMLRLPGEVEAIQQPVYPSTSTPAMVPMAPATRAMSPPPAPAAPRASYPGYLVQAVGGGPAAGAPGVPGGPLLPAPPAQPAQGPGLVSQMFADPGYSSAAQNWTGYGNHGASAPGGQQPCGQPPCGGNGECAPCFQPCWYVSAGGLFMSRDQGNRLWTSHRTGANEDQIMNTQDARFDWEAGVELRVGRTFCCGQLAFEATYWRLADFEGASSTAGVAPSTPLNFDGVIYANPALWPDIPQWLFDGAQEHRITRTDGIQNLELNLIWLRGTPGCFNDTVNIDWSVGVRYFELNERLIFSSLDGAGGSWSDLDHVGRLDEKINNSLIGAQIGFNAKWAFSPKWQLFVAPKFGIFNNHIEHRFAAYRADSETFAADPVVSGLSGEFPVSADRDVVSFLTQIDLGVNWQFAPRWDAYVGYRVVVATGIGLAENQFHPYVVDLPAYGHIETNGELVLHGAFAGLTYRF